MYAGPDAAYAGREICFASVEDAVTVVDVTDKANPVRLSRLTYSGSEYTYTHQVSRAFCVRTSWIHLVVADKLTRLCEPGRVGSRKTTGTSSSATSSTSGTGGT